MKRRFEGRSARPAETARIITSPANPLIKDIRALAMRKTREQAGLFIAEGLKLVADGLEQGWRIRFLVHRAGEMKPLLQKSIAAAQKAGGEVLEVTQAVLEKLAHRDNPQTVIGVFEQRLAPIAAVTPRPAAIWIGLDRVRDPGNLGTIIRTADAVGAEGIMLIDDCTDPFGLEAVRASMGSIFHVRLAGGSSDDFLTWRKTYSGEIIGTHLAGTVDYRQKTYPKACLLLMGNEQQGLAERLAETCDALVKIPMRAGADSLNLAVAAGVMLYEISRGRGVPD